MASIAPPGCWLWKVRAGGADAATEDRHGGEWMTVAANVARKPDMKERTGRWASLLNPLVALLLLSVLARLAGAVYLGDSVPPDRDEQSYSLLASRLAEGHGYSFAQYWYPFAPAEVPTAHWSFLYTAFVAGVYALFGPHPLAVRLVGPSTPATNRGLSSLDKASDASRASLAEA